MKKCWIAVAALGSFAGAAAAQSSLTIFGVVDVAVSKANAGTSNLSFYQDWQVGNRNQWVMHSGSSSRLGLRGAEDLGNGMKANFLLDHRFQPDTGAVEPRDGTVPGSTAANRSYNPGFWNAQSYVGLSGGFGEIRLGRQQTPHFAIALVTDPYSYEFNIAGFGAYTRGGNAITSVYNAVQYMTPGVGGFRATLQVAAGEGRSAAVGGAGRGPNHGVNLIYADGPLWAGIGFNDSRIDGSPNRNRSTVLGATYHFGAVKAIFNYSFGKNNAVGNPTVRTMLVGAHVYVGNGFVRAGIGHYDAAVGVNPNASVFSPYAASTGVPPALNGQNTTKLAVGYVYSLSKRSSVSADLATAKMSGYSRSTGYQAGIKHLF